MRSSFPLTRSQSFSVLSPLPESAVRPSGAMATLVTQSECPVKVRSSFPLARSQSFNVLVIASRERGSAVRGNGDAGHRAGVPGEGAQLVSAGQVPELQRTCPYSPKRSSAVRGNGDARTLSPECPVKVRSSFPVARSQSFSVSSELPESAVRPSGAMATLVTSSECPVKVRKLFSARQVPELQRLVQTSRERSSAVRGDRRRWSPLWSAR